MLVFLGLLGGCDPGLVTLGPTPIAVGSSTRVTFEVIAPTAITVGWKPVDTRIRANYVRYTAPGHGDHAGPEPLCFLLGARLRRRGICQADGGTSKKGTSPRKSPLPTSTPLWRRMA